MGLDEGMKLIRKGPFAFYVQDNMAYKLITDTFTEMEVCDLTEIKMLPPQNMQIAVRKVSLFRKILTYSVRRMNEHGIMARERKFWKTPTPKCVRNAQKQYSQVICQTFNYYFRNSFMCVVYLSLQVRVEYVYSVLIFLTAGYITSFGILLVELFYVKYCNNNNHHVMPQRY